ncbi:MAG: phospholipase A [Flavobacterium sp.]|nr:phospholipase A [Flavobacterium sp.]
MKKSCLFFLLFLSIAIQAQGFLNGNDIITKTYSERWELDSIDKKGTFRLMSYKPIYVTAGRWTDRPNNQPFSENPDYSTSTKDDFDNMETKFQLSFKTKVVQSLFWGKGDFWIGYTQVAHWQIYNTASSRVFREINYEPEIMFKYPLHFPLFNGEFKSVGFAFNHQSNGRDLPYSRSWNRIIFHLSYEIDNWIVTAHPWIRLADDEDENPEITKYIGNGEVNVSYTYNRHQFYSIIRHPFNTWQGGSIQLNYVFPIKGHLRGHVQGFHGYGETMIDYNHRQTTIGIGASFANW